MYFIILYFTILKHTNNIVVKEESMVFVFSPIFFLTVYSYTCLLFCYANIISFFRQCAIVCSFSVQQSLLVNSVQCAHVCASVVQKHLFFWTVHAYVCVSVVRKTSLLFNNVRLSALLMCKKSFLFNSVRMSALPLFKNISSF